MCKKFKVLILTMIFIFLFSSFCFALPNFDMQVLDIKIKGNNNILEEKLIPNLYTEIGDKFSVTKLKKDMKYIKGTGFFADVQAEVEETTKKIKGKKKEGVTLIYQVIENPILKGVKIKNNSSFNDTVLKNVLNLNTLSVVNNLKINNAISKLHDFYLRHGFSLINVKHELNEKNVLEVNIEEGKINKIKLENNDKIMESTIREEILINKNDIFNEQIVNRSVDRLENTGYFKFVNYRTTKIEDNKYNLIFEFGKIKNEIPFKLGLNYHPLFEERYIAGYKRVNPFGDKREFLIAKRHNNNNLEHYLFRYQQEDILNTSFNLIANLNRIRKKEMNGDSFVSNQLKLSTVRNIQKNLTQKVYLNYRKYSKLLDFEGNMQNERKQHSIGLKATHDTIGDKIKKGIKAKLNISYNSENNPKKETLEYIKYTFDFEKYFNLDRQNSVYLDLKLGSSNKKMPIIDRYFLNIRGFYNFENYNSTKFTGNHILEGSLEYQLRPFINTEKKYKNFTIYNYLDFGRTGQEKLQLSDLNKSAGLGVRMQTLLGELDFSYNYVFGDGKEFETNNYNLSLIKDF